MALKIERIGTTRNTLGEGPLWDVTEQALYWIDSEDGGIFRHHPATGEFKSWRVPTRIGSLALRRDSGAVLALQTGFHLFDFTTGVATPIFDPEPNLPATRLNDGKVDARGRFVVGSMDLELSKPLGALYRLDTDLKCTKLESDITCSNGPCWSPDNRTFYFTDSRKATICAYDYDLATGNISGKRAFFNAEGTGGMPDGCTVDADGRVWSSLIGSGKIACLTPAGKVERMVEVPPRLVTSVMFGGENLDVLYITSIGGFPAEGHQPTEADGGLYAIHGLGVRGLPERRFAG